MHYQIKIQIKSHLNKLNEFQSNVNIQSKQFMQKLQTQIRMNVNKINRKMKVL